MGSRFPVSLRQDFVSVEGTGGAVWRPSIQFARFVCSNDGQRRLPLAGKSVLEISSGLGLGAIVAWHLGASPVVRFRSVVAALVFYLRRKAFFPVV